jgi:hypothetical protein
LDEYVVLGEQNLYRRVSHYFVLIALKLEGFHVTSLGPKVSVLNVESKTYLNYECQAGA